jgi:hypothetical protein
VLCPWFSTSKRAPFAKGIGNQQFIPLPSCGLICSGSEAKLRRKPKPIPKKSPMGDSTLGELSPSQ